MSAEGFMMLLLALPAWAQSAGAGPSALEVLALSLSPRPGPHEALLEVVVASAAPKTVRLVSDGEGRYRRELLDRSAKAVLLAVCDGEKEWVHDLAKGRIWSGEPADPYAKRLVPEDERALIVANYELRLEPARAIAGRKAWLLELIGKQDKVVRRRLWIDRESGLVLQSRLYRPDGALAASSRLKSFRPGAVADRQFSFFPPPGVPVGRRLSPDYLAVEDAKAESGMQPQLPSWLPSGFVFESLAVIPRGKSKLLHLRFSDGVAALSLFQLPPRARLAFGKTAAERVRFSGQSGELAWTPEGHALSWAAGGARFLLVGPVDSETLKKIAVSLR